jgi:hypothetical protein
VFFLVRSACFALYPRTDKLPGLVDLDFDRFYRQFRQEAPLLLRLGVVLGALVFTLTPLLTVGWPLPSLFLPKPTLDTHAQRIASHRVYLLRQVVLLVKVAGGLCYGAHPKVRAAFALAPYPEEPAVWRS